MKSLFYSVVFLVFLITGCRRQKEYPTDTTEGNGTFGATINGKQLLPCLPAFSVASPVVINSFQHSPTHFSLSIAAKNRCDRNYDYGRSIIISFDSIAITENTTYKFGNASTFVRRQVRCIYSEELQEYLSDSTLAGNITIRRFDPVLKIVSASFNATLKEKNTGQLVNLTLGKFDLKFN